MERHHHLDKWAQQAEKKRNPVAFNICMAILWLSATIEGYIKTQSDHYGTVFHGLLIVAIMSACAIYVFFAHGQIESLADHWRERAESLRDSPADK